jgi:hypothetical protein
MDYSQNRDIDGMVILKYIWLTILWGYWVNWSGSVIGQNVHVTQWPRSCNESVHSWLPVHMECNSGLWREVPSCQELFLSQWCDGMRVTSAERKWWTLDETGCKCLESPQAEHRREKLILWALCNWVLVYGKKWNPLDVFTRGTFRAPIKTNLPVGCQEEHCLEKQPEKFLRIK